MKERSGCPDYAHVLVVEDEPLVRMIAVATLEELGCATVEASSADEALRMIEHNPDINSLFTDVQTPGDLDGLSLARLVRAKWPKIDIIICSGRVLPQKSSLPEGVRFIAKPYYHNDLIEIAKQSGC